tara:strand:+ start:134 stop:805 length:672 start_codon:yes stop_codon:yes gene_type:complete
MYENIIAIPFRNRDEHLEYFIKNTVPLIKKHMPNTIVVVVEQNEGKQFNRGAILNVAFKEYQNKTNYFFTHDVDMNPSQNVVKDIYTKENIEVFRVKRVHDQSLGGIVKIKHDTIFDINGFPNNIWGWGIEDRALYHRCRIKNVDIKMNYNHSFKIMPHASNHQKYTGAKEKHSRIWNGNYIKKLNDKQKEDIVMSSGINNVEYIILERKMIHDIVELIKVDI